MKMAKAPTRSERLATRLADLPQTLNAVAAKYGEWVRQLPKHGIPEQGIEWVAKSLADRYPGHQHWGADLDKLIFSRDVPKLAETYKAYQGVRKDPIFREVALESHPELNPRNPLSYSGTQLQHLTELYQNMQKQHRQYQEQDPEATMQQWWKQKQKARAQEDKFGRRVDRSGNISVYQPETVAAVCSLGKGTNWCTRGSNMADNYLRKGFFYIWRDDSTNEPLAQLHWNEEEPLAEFRQPDDEPMWETSMIQWADSLLARDEIEASDRLLGWAKFYDGTPVRAVGLGSLEDEFVRDFFDDPAGNDWIMAEYLQMDHDDNQPLLRSLANGYIGEQTPRTIAALGEHYPKFLKDAVGLEKASEIVSNNYNSIGFDSVVEFVVGTHQPLTPEAEEQFAETASISSLLSYARSTGKRVPSLEQRILEGLADISTVKYEPMHRSFERIMDAALQYVKLVIKGRWPELEEELAKPMRALSQRKYEDIVMR